MIGLKSGQDVDGEDADDTLKSDYDRIEMSNMTSVSDGTISS